MARSLEIAEQIFLGTFPSVAQYTSTDTGKEEIYPLPSNTSFQRCEQGI